MDLLATVATVISLFTDSKIPAVYYHSLLWIWMDLSRNMHCRKLQKISWLTERVRHWQRWYEPWEGVCSLQSCKAVFPSTAKFFGQQPAAKMKKNKQFCCSALIKQRWNSFRQL